LTTPQFPFLTTYPSPCFFVFLLLHWGEKEQFSPASLKPQWLTHYLSPVLFRFFSCLFFPVIPIRTHFPPPVPPIGFHGFRGLRQNQFLLACFANPQFCGVLVFGPRGGVKSPLLRFSPAQEASPPGYSFTTHPLIPLFSASHGFFVFGGVNPGPALRGRALWPSSL